MATTIHTLTLPCALPRAWRWGIRRFPNHQPRSQSIMIGICHSAQDSFTGQIRTLMLDVVVTLVPAQSNDSDNAPDWRVLLGDAETGTEIGAGWNRTGERAGAVVAVQIDDPGLHRKRVV